MDKIHILGIEVRYLLDLFLNRMVAIQSVFPLWTTLSTTFRIVLFSAKKAVS